MSQRSRNQLPTLHLVRGAWQPAICRTQQFFASLATQQQVPRLPLPDPENPTVAAFGTRMPQPMKLKFNIQWSTDPFSQSVASIFLFLPPQLLLWYCLCIDLQNWIGREREKKIRTCRTSFVHRNKHRNMHDETADCETMMHNSSNFQASNSFFSLRPAKNTMRIGKHLPLVRSWIFLSYNWSSIFCRSAANVLFSSHSVFFLLETLISQKHPTCHPNWWICLDLACQYLSFVPASKLSNIEFDS